MSIVTAARRRRLVGAIRAHAPPRAAQVCVDVMLPAEPPCCQLVDRCLGEDRPLVGEPNMPLRVVREPARRRPCLRYAATRGSLDRGNQLWLDRPTLATDRLAVEGRRRRQQPSRGARSGLDTPLSATRRPCSGGCSTRGEAAGSSSRRRRRSPSSERTSRGPGRRVRGRAEPAREDGRHGRRAGRLGLTSARASTSRRPARSACFCPPSRAAAPDTAIVASGFSCRSQISPARPRPHGTAHRRAHGSVLERDRAVAGRSVLGSSCLGSEPAAPGEDEQRDRDRSGCDEHDEIDRQGDGEAVLRLRVLGTAPRFHRSSGTGGRRSAG